MTTQCTDSTVLVRLLKEQSTWASICTEPAMVALAASKAASILDEPPQSIEIHLSGSVLKNALSAGLPGTPHKGPELAAALGAICASPDKGLTILGGISDQQLESALEIVASGRVAVHWAREREGVYAKCVIRGKTHTSEAIIEGSHTNFTKVSLDDRPTHLNGLEGSSSDLRTLREWGFLKLLETAASLDPGELQWLLKGAQSCMELSETARNPTTDDSIRPAWVCGSPLCDIPIVDVVGRVSRAISARMSGFPWPVVTSGGSGNQGIMVSIPIMTLAKQFALDEDKTITALAIAHSVNLLTKAYMGGVSCSCGGVGAAAGIAAAICWMRKGTPLQIEEAVTQVLASLFGMICDGAKATCALKGTTSVVTGMMTGTGASDYCGGVRDQGVVGATLDETLSRIASLNAKVINKSDELMLAMLERSSEPAKV